MPFLYRNVECSFELVYHPLLRINSSANQPSTSAVTDSVVQTWSRSCISHIPIIVLMFINLFDPGQLSQ